MSNRVVSIRRAPWREFFVGRIMMNTCKRKSPRKHVLWKGKGDFWKIYFILWYQVEVYTTNLRKICFKSILSLLRETELQGRTLKDKRWYNRDWIHIKDLGFKENIFSWKYGDQEAEFFFDSLITINAEMAKNIFILFMISDFFVSLFMCISFLCAKKKLAAHVLLAYKILN